MEGSALVDKDLERAEAQKCRAIFILCDKYTLDPEVCFGLMVLVVNH
jgi:hypothetical protein